MPATSPLLDAPPAPSPSAARRRRTLLIAAVGILAMITAVVWYLLRPAPDEVDITSAVDQIEQDGAAQATGDAGTGAETAGTGTAGTGTDGTWVVDTSVGEFSVEDTTGTFVGFRVDEELASVGATTAVGRTPSVTGELTLDGTTLSAASFSADLTALVSDESRREDAIQRALDTATYPTADFTLTEPVELGDVPTDGATTEATATGDLTIAGVTRQVAVPLQFSVTDGVAVVTGTLDVTFADYGVEVPSAPIVVSVEDSGTVELQMFLTRAGA